MPHFGTANDLRRQQLLLQVLYIVRNFRHRNGIVQCSVMTASKTQQQVLLQVLCTECSLSHGWKLCNGLLMTRSETQQL